MCQRNSCWSSHFLPLFHLDLSEIGLELSHNYPPLFNIKTSTDQLMAAVPISVARSCGFSEAHTCDSSTESQEVTIEHTEALQHASILTHSYFRF